jgi:serine protease AprX
MARYGECGKTTRWGYRTGCAVVVAALGLTVAGGTGTAAWADSVTASGAGVGVSAAWGDPVADAVATVLGRNSAAADPGSLYTVENAIRARAVWKQRDSAGRQITGQGVSVAVLDSGTAAVPGLSGPGKLSYGPDLSVESNGVLADQDTFGHGTFMAGIIAAHDGGALTANNIDSLDPSVQLGVAPDAGLVSLKLANTDGSSDVSQIIAALNWVTEHQSALNGSRVRVINLSFGTDSIQPYQLDPLAAAAENAWHHGVVVVVSGGNEGQNAGRLTNPAIDPYVLAVGASDASDSLTGWATPMPASFSNSGTAQRHVDLLAPGTSLVSLRDPGSFIDVNHPEGRVAGDVTGRLFRGSGTSQAAAVVSGAAALLLQANPNLTPDQVKAALMNTAKPVLASPIYAGAGQLDVQAALSAVRIGALPLIGTALAPPVTQHYPISTGQGSLDAARGGSAITDADGQPITGETDAQGQPWDPAAWWAAASHGTSWSGGTWMGATWTGDHWTTGSDGHNHWSAARWSAARWSDADWSAARWSAARWSASRWSAARWSAARWSDSDWG